MPSHQANEQADDPTSQRAFGATGVRLSVAAGTPSRPSDGEPAIVWTRHDLHLRFAKRQPERNEAMLKCAFREYASVALEVHSQEHSRVRLNSGILRPGCRYDVLNETLSRHNYIGP